MNRHSRTSYLVGKAFKGFLLASVLTAAASNLNALIDGLMLSHFISEQAMSAVNLTMPVIQTLFALCNLIGVGGSMLAGMAMGNHEREKASDIFSQALTAAAVTGLTLGAAGMIFMKPLLHLLCKEAAFMDYTAQYLRIIVPGAAVYMLMIAAQSFVTLDGAPRKVTLAVAVSTLVNLLLDYIFIAWLGYAMTGAALATVISYAAALCVLLPHFRFRTGLRFSLPRRFDALGRIISMGLPFGIATALIAVQLLGNNLVAMRYIGGAGVVTLSVCLYMLQLSMIVMAGALEAFQPVAAILKGSGDNRGVILVLGKAYSFLAGALGLLALALIICPGQITALFSISAPDSAAMLHEALPPYAFNIVLQCAVYLLMPVYQLYSHKNMTLIISFGQPLAPLLCYWLLAAAAASGMGWLNPWWGFALGQLLVILVLIPASFMRSGNDIPVILIPADNPDELFDVSLRPTMESMTEAIRETDGWMRRQKIDQTLRARVQLACEESVKNIIQHALQGRANSVIDLRIAISQSAVTAVIRDEGTAFNPVERDSETGLGLLLIHKTVDEQHYEYLFRQNILTMKWKR